MFLKLWANIVGKLSPNITIYRLVGTELKKLLVDFNAGKTQLVLYDQSNINDSLDVKMDGSVLEEKHLLRYWG